MIKTQIKWNRTLMPTEVTAINEEIQKYVESNETDGHSHLNDLPDNFRYTVGDDSWTQGLFTRSFQSETAAQAWLDFLNTFSPPPVIANLVK